VSLYIGVAGASQAERALVEQGERLGRRLGEAGVVVVCGGVIPPQDYDALHEAGARRGGAVGRIAPARREWDGKTLIKQEQMPDGRLKLIVKDEATGEFSDVVTEGEPVSTR
jgi:hypothetical protein